MKKNQKTRFFLTHKKMSALVVSVIIHVAFALVALTFVAVSVILKDDVDFEAVSVERPHMKLHKLQVPVNVKKPAKAPRLRKTITVKKVNPEVDIQLPEIVGVAGGIGSGSGLGGLGPGFSFDMDLFGSDNGAGNDFLGSFYDLKQDKNGKVTRIGQIVEKDGSFSSEAQTLYHEIVKSFVGSGWNINRLDDFYMAPKKKFARFFNLPPINADAAPRSFGVENDVKPSYWLCHYKGTIVARETGRYRFWGEADDVLIVRTRKKVVLDGCWPSANGTMTSWSSRDDDNRRFPVNVNAYGSFKGGNFMDYHEKIRRRLHNGESIKGILNDIKIEGKSLSSIGNYINICSRLAVGDWFELKAGQRVDMEVLIGEIPGGYFNCRLLIEKEGADYAMVDSDAGRRPVLPVFKTAPVPKNLISKMKINAKEMTVEGPVFGIEQSE